MEVILLDKVKALGQLGTRTRVKPGFARNYLIPQGKALPANEANIKRFEEKRAELEKSAKERQNAAEQRGAQLQGVTVTVVAQAGEEGRLFGSVGTHDIVRALAEAGHSIAKSEIRLPNGPIRLIGDYEIELQLLGGEIVTTINVSVVPN